MTSEPVTSKNWAGRGYNQPGPQGQDLGPGREADRGGFTGAGLFDREEIARYSLDDVRAAGRRPAPEHQQDREARE